ncbi:hypothetical protein [Arthrobacter woluwensis]|uniref:Uncharacterized protein n=1 Tax=Arthrobacter woluwensis TaxID=156980 RepID=A0A1H4QM94_9MICC|nr:hypothetical protein [Arthrobacter woluwensis]SEC20668.1 hypothetical protein SAMN04489745_2327 [Arthrobacter woluwensis]
MSRNRKKPRQDKKQAAALKQSEALYKNADRAVDTQALAFVRWYEGTDGNTGAEALQVLQSVKQFLWLYGASGAPVSATAFDADVFLQAMAQLQAMSEAGESRVFQVMTDDLQVYLGFLDATGSWTGTAEDLEVLLENFVLTQDEEAATEEAPAETVADAEAGSADASASADASVSTVRHAVALLDWLGDGKELTATGSLRLADIAGAAAAVGVHAVGSQKRLSEDEVAALADPDGRLPQVVRSMAELEHLNTLWLSLRELGYLEVTGKKATVSDAGRALQNGGAAEREALLRELAAGAELADAELPAAG